MQLIEILENLGVSQSTLAKQLGISKSLLNRIINKGEYPKKNAPELKSKIENKLVLLGAKPEEIELIQNNNNQNKEEIMLIQRQILSSQAKQHFAITRDIFGELTCQEDVFLNHQLRYTRETMYQAARCGGFLAIVGESGSGKSTLRKDLIEKLNQASDSTIIIEPYIIAMEDSNNKGKTLKARDIAEAILMALDPTNTMPRSQQQLFAKVHEALKNSHKCGNRHCLIIEEAHSMNMHTLKHLKRFYELELGFAHLLGIILLGQPELKDKLSENLAFVREVVQRIEILTLAPISDLEAYIKHRLERAGLKFEDLFDASVIPELILVMSAGTLQLTYPLAIGNVLTKAINIAAQVGLKQVNANCIKQVKSI